VQAALAFERVTKRYRASGTAAVEDISFSVVEGTRTCLLGPNGAGKSTSIKLLQGALRPTRGRVSLLGAEIDSPEYLHARRRTGIVPQSPGMYSDLTAGEYLQLAQALYQRGSIDAVVTLLDLGEHLRKPLSQLSGGFQRRVVLATALLAEPDVLLLDEPTVGLDPIATHDVHSFLSEAMRQEGRTTLLCTHNLAEAEALCDDVIILRAGRILVHAPLAELRRRTRPQLRLAARQGVSALENALRQRELEPRGDGDGVVVAVSNPEADAPHLLRGLLADGLDMYLCEPVQVTLESLFLDMVRSS
jgi:ABC-2 type transport system ATP-binding protein